MRRKKLEDTEKVEKVEKVYTHRDYYAVGRKHEPIDVIQDWDLDFCLGNVVKYISRAGRKDNVDVVEDLKKAKTYLEYEISKITDEYYPTDEPRDRVVNVINNIDTSPTFYSKEEMKKMKKMKREKDLMDQK